MQELYRVKFHQSDVWRNAGLAYEGSDLDTIVVDITRPWLLEKPTSWSPSFPASVIVPSAGCAPHHHHDDESDGEHEHAGGSPGLAPSGSAHSRAEVEQVAIDREGAEPRFKPWAECLLQLLFRKSILTPEDVHKAAASQASVLAEARGPAIIAKAWVDAAFKSRLLANAQVAVKELGIDATNPAAPTVLQALENTDSVHNLIVCTLCSCYPQAILGMSPQWYRSRSYRARYGGLVLHLRATPMC